MKTLARVAAVLSFVFCFTGGALIVCKTGFDTSKDNVVWVGMGLYFIGKSFFVGPMLWLAADKCCGQAEIK